MRWWCLVLLGVWLVLAGTTQAVRSGEPLVPSEEPSPGELDIERQRPAPPPLDVRRGRRRPSTQTEKSPRVAAPDKQIVRWVEQLGHDSYQTREWASSRLLAAGPPARQQLEPLVGSPDPELRARAERLLALIETNEFNSQLKAFAEDVDGTLGLTMPGWDEFRGVVGSDAAARRLFIEMQRRERTLLRAVFEYQSDEAPQLLVARLARLRNWGRQGVYYQQQAKRDTSPPLGSVAAVFLICTTAEVGKSDSIARATASLTQLPALAEATTSGEFSGELRTLLGHWVRSWPTKDPSVVKRKIDLTMRHELYEGLPMALAVATGDPAYGRQLPSYRAEAVLAVAKMGKPKHARLLEDLLDDASTCYQMRRAIGNGQTQVISVVQLRDVALAALLHLNGQDLKDYGYESPRRHDVQLFQPTTLGFRNDAARTAAFERWHDWRSEGG